MNLLRCLLTIACVLTLANGCGGGGGSFAAFSPGSGDGGGIGGSGITSSGEVTGFGSIFVNGIEFDTDQAEILVNGDLVSEDALGLGMVVTVEGTLNEDGRTGDAARVVFDGAVRGPVGNILPTATPEVVLLEILGITITVDRRTTVIEGADFETLGDDDLVEVSGFTETDGRLRATRIERVANFVPEQSPVDRSGTVGNLSDSTFTLGELTVEFASADVSALPGGTPSEGQRISVTGTLSDDVISATTLTPGADLRSDLADDAPLVVQGLVAAFDGRNLFRVNNLPVDAANATLEGGALGDGVLVQVTGTWDGQTLVADAVLVREGDVLIAGPVSSVDGAAGSVTLQLLNTTLTTRTTALTLIEDGTGQTDRPSLDALRAGDYVVVEANSRGQERVALRINRSRPRDNALRSQVTRITSGSSITVQDVTIETTTARLLDTAGDELTPRAFYEQLGVDDTVLVIDRQPGDGDADVVRLLGEARDGR